MAKSCHSSGESTSSSTSSASVPPTTTTNSCTVNGGSIGGGTPNNNTTPANKDQYLHHLNKISHKISKPTTSSSSASLIRRPFDPSPPLPRHPPPSLQPSQPASASSQQSLSSTQPPNQNQPPVYNISKSDFRDVVQKLTGSPAHERISSPATAPPQPPPIRAAPKPSSSRLHRIRPPPLGQLANRPPPLLGINHHGGFPLGGGVFTGNNLRQPTPLSPLPPLPGCHAAAESPISAYMRFLQTSGGVDLPDLRRMGGSGGGGFLFPPTIDQQQNLPLPPINQQSSMAPPPPPPLVNPPASVPSSAAPPTSSTLAFVQPPFPTSPLSFGCFPSPKSPNLFSPTSTSQLGFSQLPISPNVPAVPSPRWRDL